MTEDRLTLTGLRATAHHGVFDHEAGGFWSPSFLASLPATARTFATAVARTAQEKRDVRRAMAANKVGSK